MNEFLFPAPARALRYGKLTEVSAFTPIIQGRIPGERRTYEERLRFNLQRLTETLNAGLPSELHLIHNLHFGRITIIRPEQYLMFKRLKDAKASLDEAGNDQISPDDLHLKLMQQLKSQPAFEVYDEYCEECGDDGHAVPGEFQSWALTQVVFDGDIKAYFRDIAHRLGSFFDAIYENCELYPGTKNFEKFWQWIYTYQIESDMFYAGNPHLSVARIRELEDFKKRFDIFVTKVRSANGSKASNMDELFDQFLMETRQHASGFPSSGGIYSGALDAAGADN